MTTLPNKAKYVIIGAGIHGLSTAWHLGEKLKKNFDQRASIICKGNQDQKLKSLLRASVLEVLLDCHM